jgi:flagellar P-ring protein precursor FlgI
VALGKPQVPKSWVGWRNSSHQHCSLFKGVRVNDMGIIKNKKRVKRLAVLLLVLLQFSAFADRIKDLSTIQGIRTNQLVGYGLVVGLEGSGDKRDTAFTKQSFLSMLKQFGITPPSVKNFDTKNVAAVALSAELPAFAKRGQRIDVTVSSIGSAKSLRGGTLLMAPLKGADGKVYAVAQGSLLVSGFGGQGADGSRITVNISSVGRIPNGATVERTVPSSFYNGGQLVFSLHQADFTTSKRMVEVINRAIGPGTAKSIDAMSIRVNAPKEASQRVEFVSVIENLNVVPDDAKAKVVVNSRTGTIVIGQYVKIRPVAISHGSLTVSINENPIVSQPNAFAGGETTLTPSSAVKITEGTNRMFYFQGNTSLQDLVNAVNAVGAAPGDLMAVLEALKEVGAFKADLVVI